MTHFSHWRPGDLMLRRVDPASGRFVGEPMVLLANLPDDRTMRRR